MIIHKIHLTISDRLLAIFLTTFIITRIVAMPVLIANMLPAMCGLFSLLYLCVRKVKHVQTAIFISIILSVFMLLSMLMNRNCNFLDIIWIWSFMGIAMLLYSFEINSQFIMFQYCCFVAYIIFKIVSGVSYKSIILVGSENNISVYLLLYIALYLITCDNGKKLHNIVFLPVLLGLVCTVWSASRSGVLSFVLLSVLLIAYNMKKNGKKIKYIMLTAISMLVLYFIIDNFFASTFMNLQNKINNYGNSSLRTVIWNEYIHSATSSLYDFIFGPNTVKTGYKWLSYYGGNTHNAFLMLHSHFGIIVFAYILIALFVCIGKLYKNGRMLSAIAIGVLCVRSMFDWTSFPGVYHI